MGPENVFVGIWENGSQDKTKELREFSIDHSISLNTAQKPKLDTPNILNFSSNRIVCLAKVRNHLLDLLQQLSIPLAKFDKVLFINDVLFAADDIIDLLRTNNGTFDAACAMDFGLWGFMIGGSSIQWMW
jgi:hypothetical protein